MAFFCIFHIIFTGFSDIHAVFVLNKIRICEKMHFRFLLWFLDGQSRNVSFTWKHFALKVPAEILIIITWPKHLKIKGWRTSFEARNSAEQTTICGFFFISSLNSSVWYWRHKFRWTGFMDLEMLNNLPPNHNPDAQSVTFALDLLGNWGQWYNQQNSRTWRMHCTCML